MLPDGKWIWYKRLGRQNGVTMVEYVLVLLFVVAVAALVFDTSITSKFGKALNGVLSIVRDALYLN